MYEERRAVGTDYQKPTRLLKNYSKILQEYAKGDHISMRQATSVLYMLYRVESTKNMGCNTPFSNKDQLKNNKKLVKALN